MDKPVVFNYKKAMDTIAELTGDIIHLNLEIEHLKKRNEPMKLEIRQSRYFCPECGRYICGDVQAMEVIRDEKLYEWCPSCGQKLEWRNGND